MRRATSILLSLAVLLLVACGGGAGSSGQPTTTTGGPSTLGGAPVVSLAVGPEIEVPNDVALIIETGCTECDGPTDGLIRVYRDASGQVKTDQLFETPADPPHAFTSSFALSADASTIIVGVCPQADCPFLGPGQPDARTVLYRSTDGGVTWGQLDTPRGVYNVRAVIGENAILQGPLDEQGFVAHTFQAFPGGAPVASPEPQSDLLMLGGGEMVWLTADGRLLGVNGGPLVSLPEGYKAAGPAGGRFWLDPAEGQFPAVVYDDNTGYHLGLFAGGGEPMRFYPLEGYASIGGWLDAERAIGNATVSSSSLTSEVPGPFQGEPLRFRRSSTLPLARSSRSPTRSSNATAGTTSSRSWRGRSRA